MLADRKQIQIDFNLTVLNLMDFNNVWSRTLKRWDTRGCEATLESADGVVILD